MDKKEWKDSLVLILVQRTNGKHGLWMSAPPSPPAYLCNQQWHIFPSKCFESAWMLALLWATQSVCPWGVPNAICAWESKVFWASLYSMSAPHHPGASLQNISSVKISQLQDWPQLCNLNLMWNYSLIACLFPWGQPWSTSYYQPNMLSLQKVSVPIRQRNDQFRAVHLQK